MIHHCKKDGAPLKRILSLLVILIFTISLSACRSPHAPETLATTVPPQTTKTEPPFDGEAFKGLVSGCAETMSKNTTLLSIVALYEQSYWESLEQLGGTVTAEKLTAAGYKYLSENTDYSKDDIASWHDSIMAAYKVIVTTDIDGAEAESILEVFNEYIDAYLSLHNLATSPSGKLSEFEELYRSYTDTIDNCKAKLGALIS